MIPIVVIIMILLILSFYFSRNLVPPHFLVFLHPLGSPLLSQPLMNGEMEKM